MKRRLAIWMHGGIGTGHFSQGYPMIGKIVEKLCESFDVVVYSQSAPASAGTLALRTASPSIKRGWVRWLALSRIFFADHRRQRFDVLLAFWGYPAGFLLTCISKITNLPVAIYLLGSDAAGIPAINFGILHKPIPRRLALWAYRRAALLLAISGYQEQQLVHAGLSRSLLIIPWGADPTLYKYRFKTPSSPVHILHVGHLNPVKDQAMLLRAFTLILQKRPVELRIIGADHLDGQVQRLCKTLGLDEHVRFLEMVPYSEMPAHYEWADVVLHTSLSEGQSMALTEAAAVGVLLAGTRVGLIWDLGDAGAVTATVGDYTGLAENMLRVMDDAAQWEARVKNARQWSDEHDFAWTIRELSRELNAL
jgi:glycosyltransferase involved in cell wall biosynthesis